MPDPRPPIRIHVLALGALSAIVALVVVVYFLRSILGVIEAYHQLCVVAFLIAFALWCYWVVVALVRRRLSSDGRRESTSSTSRQ